MLSRNHHTNVFKLRPIVSATLQVLSGSLGVCLHLTAIAQTNESIINESSKNPVLLAQLDQKQEKELAFNTAFFKGAASYADVHSLLGGGGISPGTYRVDLYVNRYLNSRFDIVFSRDEKSNQVEPCFTVDFLRQIGINIEKLEHAALYGEDSSCLRIQNIIPQASANYDSARLRLDITVPQLYMSPARRGYVDPSLWNNGVPVLFTNYNFNTRHSSGGGLNNSQRYTNVNFNAGLNFGPWRLRNNSSLSSGTNTSTSFQSQNTYVQRDIVALQSQLWLGETYTASQLFNSVRFRGIQLASDEAMLPDSERGYAPVIRGTADSNATVEVRQNGFLLYSTTVAPGPFEITDLSPSGSNGNLEVTVIEADGSRRTTIQAFSSPPLMVREGRIKYDLAVGEYVQQQGGGKHPLFANTSVLYGLTSDMTIAGGAQVSSGYQAFSAGVGLNTRAGAFSLDGIHSRSKVANVISSGQSLRFLFNKHFPATGTGFNASWQHSLSKGYYTLADHVSARNENEMQLGSIFSNNVYGLRSQASIYLNQNVGSNSKYGNFYLSASDSRYWGDSKTRSVSAGYSHSIGSVSFNLSYTHSKNVSTDFGYGPSSNNAVTLSVSIPLGSPGGYTPYSYTTITRQNSKNTINTGVSGSLPIERQVSYSIATGRDANGTTNSSAYLGTTTSVAQVNAGYSRSNKINSYSVQASGSIVVHQGGINLGQTVGDTFALAHVDPAVSGVGMSTRAGVETGLNGYAIVPYLTPYRANWVGINAKNLSADVEITENMMQVVPTRGAVVLATFKSDTGRRIQFEFKLSDGTPFPFGAVVETINGERLGITDPRGRALVLLSEEQQKQADVMVQWDHSECRIPYSLPDKVKGENYTRIILVCNDILPSTPKNESDSQNIIARQKPVEGSVS